MLKRLRTKLFGDIETRDNIKRIGKILSIHILISIFCWLLLMVGAELTEENAPNTPLANQLAFIYFPILSLFLATPLTPGVVKYLDEEATV